MYLSKRWNQFFYLDVKDVRDSASFSPDRLLDDVISPLKALKLFLLNTTNLYVQLEFYVRH